MIARVTLSLEDVDWPVRTRRLEIRPAIHDEACTATHQHRHQL